ncbi:PocR ligand-binding domain-containing protein [Desulfosediminicola flagellatus]|uniref:PocR ligand-binding domain-containing protein n=1 Tax=Desulfosediminicola flagellatus TaxID=2569541 RepID=UPI00142EE4B7|nr:PocR ligand-binding domain-containing protein [Desulfosediminicola flagellatus]
MSSSFSKKQQRITDDNFTITDLIPLAKLQALQDAFAEANQVASTIVTLDGVAITEPSNHSKVCLMVRSTAKGLANCIQSGKILGQAATRSKKPIHYTCQSIGFTDAAAPIIVNGRHIGNWLIGQYDIGDADEQSVREYALKIGADPELMVDEFLKMPKHSLEDFEKKLTFLGLMANELSQIAYQELLLQIQTDELNLIKKQLEDYQNQLEQKVTERTRALSQANSRLTKEIQERAKVLRKQSRLITAIESAVESIIITSVNGKIMYVNPAFEKLTGYSQQEVIGKTPKILQSGYHDNQFYTNLWETITRGDVWFGRLTNKKKDGTLYQEDSTISPVKDEKGTVISFVAVKKDITKELQLEQQLVQAKRLESIGVLAAGVAHEINTPIQYVLTNTHFFKEALKELTEMQNAYQNLADEVSSSGSFESRVASIKKLAEDIDIENLLTETHEAIDQALTGIQRISSTVGALKDFAQPTSHSMQPHNLNDLINSAVTVSHSAWYPFAEMRLDLADNLMPVPILADKFKQILLDMILNATQSIEEKYGDNLHPEGRIRIATLAEENHVKVIIDDNGTGIPDDIIDKIFDPFFTTKPVGKGSGQGLSVAHGIIVDNHRGTIAVASVPGKSTTFTITLPA